MANLNVTGNLSINGNAVATVSQIPTVDSSLSNTSTNPVQNKAVQSAIASIHTLTSLWSGSVASGNVILSQNYKNFYKILFKVQNNSSEISTYEIYTEIFQSTTSGAPYNLANSHSSVARYINIYPSSNLQLTISGHENLTLLGVYGVWVK